MKATVVPPSTFKRRGTMARAGVIITIFGAEWEATMIIEGIACSTWEKKQQLTQKIISNKTLSERLEGTRITKRYLKILLLATRILIHLPEHYIRLLTERMFAIST